MLITAEEHQKPVAEPAKGVGKRSVAVFFVFLVIFVLSPVRQVSDAAYSLLVSEGLLRHASATLDRWVEPPLDPGVHPGSVDGGLPYQLVASDGHTYYRYPHGSSVLSLPYVALCHVFGMSAIYPDGGGYHYREERRMQLRLAALLMAGFALVTYRLARHQLSERWSLVLTAAVALTTPVWSTASRGLWSHTWAILLVLIAIGILVRHGAGNGRLHPILLGTILIWAYFTRPTMAIAVVAVGIYIGLRYRKAVIPYAASVVAWLSILAATSWWQYGTLVPPYFRPDRLGTPDFWAGLAGTMISPSRGLLIFLPHLVVIAIWLFRSRRRTGLDPLAVLAILASLAHILVVASWSQWWGGDGYGPRLMTDAIPWMVLAAVVAIRSRIDTDNELRRKQPTRRRIELAALVVLSAVSLYMHGAGALSAKTNAWNWTPVQLSEDSSRVWDWEDPQFLAPFLDR